MKLSCITYLTEIAPGLLFAALAIIGWIVVAVAIVRGWGRRGA